MNKGENHSRIIDPELIPDRLGNHILDFPKGTIRESGAIITERTKTADPEIWSRVPEGIKTVIKETKGSLLIDTVGNTVFQRQLSIPAINKNSTACITPLPSSRSLENAAD